MSDAMSVDSSYISNLAQQFRDAQNELGQQINQFSAGSNISGAEYGNLPASGEASSSYRESTESMLNNLNALHQEYGAHADYLESAAQTYRDAENEAVQQGQRLNSELDLDN